MKMNLINYLNLSKYTYQKCFNSFQYQYLNQLTQHYKNQFKELSINDRVLIQSPKSIDYVAMMLATWEQKAIFIPVHEIQTSHIQKCKPNFIIQNKTIVNKCNHPKLTNVPIDIATIVFTSGSSGEPKGILLSHQNIISNLKMIDELYSKNITEKDSSFSILPWYHIYGFVCELLYLLSKGSHIHIPTYQQFPKKMVKEIKWARPTLLFTVPKFLYQIKKFDSMFFYIPQWIKKQLFFGNRVRMISVGGSYCSSDVIQWIEKNYKIPIYQGYGMTECGPMISLNNKNTNKIGSVGKPLLNVKITFNDKNEIIVKSPSLMIGYLDGVYENQLRYTCNSYQFETGDKGYIDKDGYLYVTGRVKSEFKLLNGKYINSVYIEDLIAMSPYIEQVLIIPSINYDYLICLVYSSTNDISFIRQEVLSRLKNKVEMYELPKEILLLKEPCTFENKLLTLKHEIKRNMVSLLYYHNKLSLLNDKKL